MRSCVVRNRFSSLFAKGCLHTDGDTKLAESIFQTRFRKFKNYRKMYFKMNSIANTYINALIFLSFASPVIRLITTQEIIPIEIPSEML